MLQGTGFVGERVLPRLAIPVGSALLVTLLYWLTGWAWFDLGPWPWALGALPLAVLLGLRLQLAIARHSQARTEVLGMVQALRTIGDAVQAQGGDTSTVAGLLRLFRQRFSQRPLLSELAQILGEDELAQVRASPDPQSTLVELVQSAAKSCKASVDEPLAQVRAGLDYARSVGSVSSPLAIGSEVVLLFLATLPVGLVTTTGTWTFLAVGGVSLAYLLLDVLAEEHERPVGHGASWQELGALIASAERSYSPARPVPPSPDDTSASETD